MNEVIVICCSRGRPKMLEMMMQSFSKTSKISSLWVLLDGDDPYLEENIQRIRWADGQLNYSYGSPNTTTELINNELNFKKWQKKHKFYCVTNDDFIYHTDGWDVILTDEIKSKGKVGIAYGNDMLQGKNMPTTSVISREIVEALGWLQLPTLKHLYGDNVWKTIGTGANCLYYRPDVIIEHKHYFAKKVAQDETFLKTNSKEMYQRDQLAFVKWMTEQSKADIEKVKMLCEQSLV